MVLGDGGAQLLPPTLELGGGNTMLSGQAPGQREPTLGRINHHWRRKACMQGWAEKHRHDFSLRSPSKPNSAGVDLPTKSGGTSQGLWARGQRLQGRFAVAQVRGSAGTGRSQPGGADKGGRNRGDLVQGSRHQVSGSRMRATTVSCNPRGERSQAGRHHLNLGSRPCRG